MQPRSAKQGESKVAHLKRGDRRNMQPVGTQVQGKMAAKKKEKPREEVRSQKDAVGSRRVHAKIGHEKGGVVESQKTGGRKVVVLLSIQLSLRQMGWKGKRKKK